MYKTSAFLFFAVLFSTPCFAVRNETKAVMQALLIDGASRVGVINSGVARDNRYIFEDIVAQEAVKNTPGNLRLALDAIKDAALREANNQRQKTAVHASYNRALQYVSEKK